MDESCELLLTWLRRRSGPAGRRPRAADVAQRAATALRMDPVSVYGAFRELRAAGLVSYTPDTMGLPYSGFLTVVAAVVEEPATEQAWRRALAQSSANAELSEALLMSHELFDGLDAVDMQHAITGLLRIREVAPSLGSTFGFSLSAQQVLGSSKVLNRLPLATLRLLGVERLISTPRYLVVAGPAQPKGVLLIENTTSFELAVKAGLDAELALVAAHGYGLNMMSDSSAGLALLESVRNRGCEVLSRTGSDHNLAELFSHQRVYFWGDLDREGLRIALALKQHIPQLELSGLYLPMRVMAGQRETSHPYTALSGKAQQAPWTRTGNDLFDELAAVCDLRAVDQEALDIGANKHLASLNISEALWEFPVGQKIE